MTKKKLGKKMTKKNVFWSEKKGPQIFFVGYPQNSFRDI